MLRNAASAAAPAWTWPATEQPRVDLYRLRKATLYADIIEAGGISPKPSTVSPLANGTR